MKSMICAKTCVALSPSNSFEIALFCNYFTFHLPRFVALTTLAWTLGVGHFARERYYPPSPAGCAVFKLYFFAACVRVDCCSSDSKCMASRTVGFAAPAVVCMLARRVGFRSGAWASAEHGCQSVASLYITPCLGSIITDSFSGCSTARCSAALSRRGHGIVRACLLSILCSIAYDIRD